MIKQSIFSRLFFGFCLLWMAQNLMAQSKADSIYNAAILNVYDNPDKSIEVGNQIFKENKNNPEKQIQALLLISNAYSSKRDYEKALNYALKTREINKTLNKPILNMQILNRIAGQYHQLGVNDKALQVLDEADLAASNYPHKDSIRFLMGTNFATRGFIYRDQLSCDIAIEYLQKAYKQFSSSKETAGALVNKSVTAYNIGNCYITLNQLDSAKWSFLNSKLLAEKAEANSLQAFSLKGLAKVYTLESKYKEALTELEKAHNLASEVGDLVLNRGIFEGMSENYLALKDWSNYQVYNSKAEKESQLIKENERKTIKSILANYSVETLEKEKQLKWKYGSLIFVGILGTLFVLIILIKSQFSFQKNFQNLKSQIKS